MHIYRTRSHNTNAFPNSVMSEVLKCFVKGRGAGTRQGDDETTNLLYSIVYLSTFLCIVPPVLLLLPVHGSVDGSTRPFSTQHPKAGDAFGRRGGAMRGHDSLHIETLDLNALSLHLFPLARSASNRSP